MTAQGKAAVALVTGGAGFIGSHLVERLLKDGYRVRVLDNFSTGKRENLAELQGALDVQEGSILDAAVLGRVCQGAEFIFHLAALPSVARSLKQPELTHEQLATGTLRVLLAAREAGVRRVVYGASSSAYGDIESDQKQESLPPQPISPYAAAKLAGEFYHQVFAQVYGLETVSLRFFNVFGPKQDPDSEYAAVIPRFVKLMLADERPTIFGDGLQSRDFTFVANVVDGMLLAAHAPAIRGQTINIATGERIRVVDLVQQINAILGKRIDAIHDAPRTGDIRHSLADITIAKRLLGYQPRVSFSEGLQQTVAWFAERSKSERSFAERNRQ
ncbi:MAG: SDR family oxidoreductase [Chloroflexi bacterium]|nr:SDR family oxidoreductase [Chloroflexota bacterium]